MSFADKMQVATIVLEYANVAFGYSVTIPVLTFALCWLFRVRISEAIGRVRKFSFGGAVLELTERAALVKYRADVEQSAQTVKNLSPHDEKVAEAIASLFSLSASLLPLIPKRDRRRFIEEATETLPQEFVTFRAALFVLADHAPEVHMLGLSDVLGLADIASLASPRET